ncbi:hypothetical protein G9A89_001848 [Geosiphon pyriformis]|nr:hypothetical protein G9A89_001848 [Geosiphon pyriformis]
MSPTVFETLLKYMYTGKIDMTCYKPDLYLLKGAKYLGIPGLALYLQDYMIKNDPLWVNENLPFVLQQCHSTPEFAKLVDYCRFQLRKNPSRILRGPTFTSISEKLLLSLLERDDLDMDEIEIWDKVLAWSLDKHKDFDPDVKKWSTTDIEKMYNTLSPFIPHIRFFQISQEDYFLNIRPYKFCLPAQLREDLKVRHYLPGSTVKTTILPPRVRSMEI